MTNVRKCLSRSPQKRAQSALDVVGAARDQATMAAVLRRVQPMSMADQLAELDYSDAEGARSLTASRITAERWGEAATRRGASGIITDQTTART